MSYRLEADVYYPYARLDKRILDSGKGVDIVMRSKANVAVRILFHILYGILSLE